MPFFLTDSFYPTSAEPFTILEGLQRPSTPDCQLKGGASLRIAREREHPTPSFTIRLCIPYPHSKCILQFGLYLSPGVPKPPGVSLPRSLSEASAAPEEPGWEAFSRQPPSPFPFQAVAPWVCPHPWRRCRLWLSPLSAPGRHPPPPSG